MTKIKWESPTMELASFLDENFGFDLLPVCEIYNQDGDVENVYKWIENSFQSEKDIVEAIESLYLSVQKFKKQ